MSLLFFMLLPYCYLLMLSLFSSATSYAAYAFESITPQKDSSPETEFLNMHLKMAMNRSIDELNRIAWLEQNSQNRNEKAALSDCSMFYNITIYRLEQILDPGVKSDSFDVQTWLSAAATSIDNCKNTIEELNVRNNDLAFQFNGASQIISDSLVISDKIMKDKNEVFKRLNLKGDFSRLQQKSDESTELVVAQDGSGNFRTIKEALESLKRDCKRRISIHIKQGTYNEYLEINYKMKNIMFTGDGIGKTIISGNKCFAQGSSTLASSTIKIMGDGFVARDITFRNTAGPYNAQAVALYSSSDKSAFYRCAFEGYQDTLWVDSNRQFYRDCHIYGTVDFIFGNAAVVFQNSLIYARKPKPRQSILVTAQGRKDPNEPTGMSFINCKVLGSDDFKPESEDHKVYLGRPWQRYARVLFIKSFLDDLIHPLGWLEWKGRSSTRTVYYGEYANYGPGSSTKGRVKWPGYKAITDANDANSFSVSNFIEGQSWIPETGVPFSAGLD